MVVYPRFPGTGAPARAPIPVSSPLAGRRGLLVQPNSRQPTTRMKGEKNTKEQNPRRSNSFCRAERAFSLLFLTTKMREKREGNLLLLPLFGDPEPGRMHTQKKRTGKKIRNVPLRSQGTGPWTCSGSRNKREEPRALQGTSVLCSGAFRCCRPSTEYCVRSTLISAICAGRKYPWAPAQAGAKPRWRGRLQGVVQGERGKTHAVRGLGCCFRDRGEG